MGTTSPDNIAFPDTGTAWASTSDFSVLASSVQSAFNSRQRYDYVWPNATARTAQTGMTQGSRGYQVNSVTEYIYDNSAWRVTLPYAEYTSGTATLAGTAYTSFSAISINSSTSTSTTFATSSGSVITCAQGGIYVVSVYGVCSTQVNTAFLMVGIATDATTNFNSQIGRSQFGGDNATINTFFYRHPGPSGQFFFLWKQNDSTSRNYSATIRLMRIG